MPAQAGIFLFLFYFSKIIKAFALFKKLHGNKHLHTLVCGHGIFAHSPGVGKSASAKVILHKIGTYPVFAFDKSFVRADIYSDSGKSNTHLGSGL